MYLIELALATWRLSDMLVNEYGPNGVLFKLRERSGVDYDADGNVVLSYNDWTPLHCVRCTSMYVGLVLVFAPRWLRLGLAASGAAVLAEVLLKKESDDG